jgi:hypothetical protein
MRIHSNTRLWLSTLLILAASAFADGFPKNCTEEIIALSKTSNFDMQKFMTDLPPAIAKVKLGRTIFYNPKDNEKTSIGMTVGCLKAFPEAPSEMQSLLKDIISNQLSTNAQALPQHAPQQAQPNYPPQQAQPQHLPQQGQYQYHYHYHYYPQQQIQTQCASQEKQIDDENFSGWQRFGTLVLNIIPGIGSALIMQDVKGALIQIGLGATGITFMAVGEEKYETDRYCSSYDNNGICRYYSGGDYKKRYDNLSKIGSGLLLANYIFSIYRTFSYDKPSNNIASNEHSGFNLAVLPNQRGEVMPYLTYNKSF